MKQPPSIFNDVLGPVMRGPSSSHSAAALRIGRLGRDLMNSRLEEVIVEYDPNGSLVTTHESQGSDLGLFGGLLGWNTDDARLPNYKFEIEKSGVRVDIRYVRYGADHPNTYRLTLRNSEAVHQLTAISTGGGMIEVVNVDGIPLQIAGDYFETLIFMKGSNESVDANFADAPWVEDFRIITNESCSIAQIKSRVKPAEAFLDHVRGMPHVSAVRVLEPVLPVLGRKDLKVPFLTCNEMLEYRLQQETALELWELAAKYEAVRGGISCNEVFVKMGQLVETFESTIQNGLKGVPFGNRILPVQSSKFAEMAQSGQLMPGDLMNRIILYVTATMEAKSSMGVIVAAPTAGSCGVLPGALFGASDVMNIDRDQRVKAMLVAGLIGVFVAARSSFAAEVAGCMAECGSASSMAAAALVFLAGGSLEQQLSAASQALQNSFGMTCDTVANRVEAPCLGKNVMAATNALACANMALADYLHLIPLDQVIEAMRQVGDLMPRELRCTGLGGLAITPASREIEKNLSQRLRVVTGSPQFQHLYETEKKPSNISVCQSASRGSDGS